MKVLLIDQNSAVTWKYPYSLANALYEKGIDISVVTDTITDKENLKCNQIKLFNTDDKSKSKLSKLINYYTSYKKILKIVKKEKVDIVHIQWLTFSPLDYYFIKKLKKYTKVVMTIHDINAFDTHKFDKKYYPKAYELLDHIILQTEDNIKNFEEIFPKIEKSKISLAYHGHFLEYGHLLNKDECRKKLGIASDKFVFMFFGQIKKIKGVDILIKAFHEAKPQMPNAYLLIAGSVWKNSFEQYQDLIDEFGLEKDVKTDIYFIPDDMVDTYFSSCDVVCLPYTKLYQSGVVQLSYAYKKPAIVSDLEAFKTVVKNNETGWIFKSESFIEMGNKMKLAYNSNKISEFGNNGYKYIEDKYSWKKIADVLIDIYSK